MPRIVYNPDGSISIDPAPGDENLPPITTMPVLPGHGRNPEPGDTYRDGTPVPTGGTVTGNPFGTPLAGLALEMAVRNQQLLDRIPTMTANQRNLINRRLTRYGGDISQYEPYMEVGYDPTVKAMQTTLEGQRDYLVGLPELMMKANKEAQKSGVTYKAPDHSELTKFWENLLNPPKMPAMLPPERTQVTPSGMGSGRSSTYTAPSSRRSVSPKRLSGTSGNYFGGYKR